MINKNELIKNINSLSRDEKKHIFNILIESKCTYSLNNNGYFYNLSHLSDEFQTKLLKCTELIFRHRLLINEFENKRAIKMIEYRDIINKSINNKKKQADILLDIIDINCNIKWTINKQHIDKISYPYIPIPISKNSVYQRIKDNMRELHKLNKKKQIIQHYTNNYVDDEENDHDIDNDHNHNHNDHDHGINIDLDPEPELELELELNTSCIEIENEQEDIINLIRNTDENDYININFIHHCESMLNNNNAHFSKDDICVIQDFITQYYYQEKQSILKKSVFKKLTKYKQIIINRDPSIVFQFILSIENLIT
jgi:hypothetical protein